MCDCFLCLQVVKSNSNSSRSSRTAVTSDALSATMGPAMSSSTGSILCISLALSHIQIKIHPHQPLSLTVCITEVVSIKYTVITDIIMIFFHDDLCYLTIIGSLALILLIVFDIF